MARASAIITSIVTIACTCWTNGAQQTVNFAQGGSDFLQLKAHNGDVLTTATIFLGIFSTTPTGTETADELNSTFTQFGSSSSEINTSGLFLVSSFSDDPSAPPYTSQQAFIVIANNPDLSLASEVAVMTNTSDIDWLFSTGAVASATAIDLEEDIFDKDGQGAQLIFGSRVGTPNDGSVDAIQLSAITVSEPPYTTWVSFHGLSGDAALEMSNPAGDGISNLMKYALQLDPNEFVSAETDGLVPGKPAIIESGEGLKFTFLRNAEASDLT